MALVKSFSGIRGIYGKELTESTAIKYAYSYCSFLQNKAKKKNPLVVIGTDTRPSGNKISDAILGILDCSFVDVGIAPTPAIEFAVRHFNADGGIIVTASHNEPYYNGFKFLSASGAILGEKEMLAVIEGSKYLKNFHRIQERRIFEGNTEAIKNYYKFLLGIIGRENAERIKNSGQSVIIDPNGGTGAIAKKLLEQAGVKVTGVNMPYGEFNRKVEPNEDSLFYLKNVIEENKSDFAAGFDCDADRVEILMENGQLLSGNNILALLVDEALSNAKNPQRESVVVNDATSNVVRDVVNKFGARLREVEAGEANVVSQMDGCKAIIGGEGSSGGVIIPPSKCRDGILTLLMLISIIAKRQESLEEITSNLPKYYSLQRKAEFKASKYASIRKSIKEHYSKKGFAINETGGVKGSLKIITGAKSFVWFRASKTEDGIFRIISDSGKKEEAQSLMEEALKVFDGAMQ